MPQPSRTDLAWSPACALLLIPKWCRLCQSLWCTTSRPPRDSLSSSPLTGYQLSSTETSVSVRRESCATRSLLGLKLISGVKNGHAIVCLQGISVPSSDSSRNGSTHDVLKTCVKLAKRTVMTVALQTRGSAT